MRTSPAKYLFDNDFGASRGVKPSVTLVEHAAKLADAEAAAYRNGFAAAAAEARASIEQRTATALEHIAATLEEFGRSLSVVEARLETEAVEVAVAVAKKLAPELVAREPFAEISALATNCFQHLVAAPHVVVRVNDAQHASATEKLDSIVRARGLDSRLVVLAEPDIAPGDCRIEWADGGISRDRAATEAAINEAVARYISARLAAPATPELSRRTEQ
jgi:flagellar assembly protein FliH